jgi:hypothetical protein
MAMMRTGALRALQAAVMVASYACAAVAEAPERSPHPVPRPAPEERQAVVLPPPVIEPVTPEAPLLPPQIYSNGHLCGDPTLTGVPVKPIRGAARGCGIVEPVQITAVGGIGLSRPIHLDCPTARALRLWVDLGVKPAIGPLGGGLAGLEVAGAYSCRPRNNIRGRKMSEHGRGRAVDVFGFILLNGQTLTVLERWGPLATRQLFRQLHASACGPFGTVLGPAADRHHQDHFHLDTQRRLNGDYCQ